ncbi:MAG TPA: SelT/SelW/SelH family protein [Microlunatus sp.]|nr:SelT/SelW/SelH family protein [Microlunatus sp.]
MSDPHPDGRQPRIVITYCTQCRWLLRAGWVAQELLTTFATDLQEIALRPGVGGVFQVELDDELVWDRKRDGGFPEIAGLKRLVRDRVAPGRTLGHSDRTAE